MVNMFKIIIFMTAVFLGAAFYLDPKKEMDIRKRRDVVDICDSIVSYMVGNLSLGNQACAAFCIMEGFKTGECSILKECDCNNITVPTELPEIITTTEGDQ